MKNKFFLWLSLLITLSIVLYSCRNEDFAKAETDPQRNNANFFKHQSDIYSKAGVDYINILEAYNKETDFLSTMPDQRGIPIWDKMQIFDAEGATGLMIPLSYDNETLSSILFANLDEKNSVLNVKNYDNSILKNLVYNTEIDIKARTQMFYTFMYVDHQTFGTESFTGIPYDMFDGDQHQENSNTYGRVWLNDFKSPSNPHYDTSKMTIMVDICVTSWHCKEGKSWKNCDKCGTCLSYSCTTIGSGTFDDPIYSPGTGTSPGSGGGGGGSPSPEGIPPVDPCTQSGMPFYRIAPQCAGNNGGGNLDDEELLPPQSPCETLTKAKQDSKVNNALEELKSKTLLKQEYTYEISRKYNNSTQDYDYDTNLKIGDGFSVVVSTGEYIKGNAHNHPSDGVRIPSVGDIMWMKICKENIAPSKAVAYNIIVCSNPINPNDTTKANIYAIATDDYDSIASKIDEMLNRSDLAGKSYDEKRQKLLDEDDRYYAGINENSTELEIKFLQKYGSFGLGLYKFDKTTNKWTKLTYDGNIITLTPCE